MWCKEAGESCRLATVSPITKGTHSDGNIVNVSVISNELLMHNYYYKALAPYIDLLSNRLEHTLVTLYSMRNMTSRNIYLTSDMLNSLQQYTKLKSEK